MSCSGSKSTCQLEALLAGRWQLNSLAPACRICRVPARLRCARWQCPWELTQQLRNTRSALSTSSFPRTVMGRPPWPRSSSPCSRQIWEWSMKSWLRWTSVMWILWFGGLREGAQGCGQHHSWHRGIPRHGQCGQLTSRAPVWRGASTKVSLGLQECSEMQLSAESPSKPPCAWSCPLPPCTTHCSARTFSKTLSVLGPPSPLQKNQAVQGKRGPLLHAQCPLGHRA
mmetsp:Transcript_9912/g.13469  ORF Transcript_9912/g.13469 Transcript_9912/m.13469 type:complete len:227 (+) Transcript_9912:421-1101(+)